MMYNYTLEKKELFTEDGQVQFLKVRDEVKRLIKIAGACREVEILRAAGSGSSWTQIACIDRLVELGEIVELKRECWSQYRIFTEPKAYNH